ncbi:MAG: TM2 domain-containing protein [Candidatus Bipolaricaulota bacterium]|nr:TM2 domain-containing protein [Candidatus Bipolaricaulota bacterium]
MESEAVVAERALDSPKSWLAALILSLVGGWLGLDQFYLGNVGLGVAKLVTLGAGGIWWFVDIVLIATGFARDAGGRRLAVGQVLENKPGGLSSGKALFTALGAAAGGAFGLVFFSWGFIIEYLAVGSFTPQGIAIKAVGLVLAGAILILALYTPRYPRAIGPTLVVLAVLLLLVSGLAFSWLPTVPTFVAQLGRLFRRGWAVLLYLTLPLGMWPLELLGVPLAFGGGLLALAGGLLAITGARDR